MPITPEQRAWNNYMRRLQRSLEKLTIYNAGNGIYGVALETTTYNPTNGQQPIVKIEPLQIGFAERHDAEVVQAYLEDARADPHESDNTPDETEDDSMALTVKATAKTTTPEHTSVRFIIITMEPAASTDNLPSFSSESNAPTRNQPNPNTLKPE